MDDATAMLLGKALPPSLEVAAACNPKGSCVHIQYVCVYTYIYIFMYVYIYIDIRILALKYFGNVLDGIVRLQACTASEAYGLMIG